MNLTENGKVVMNKRIAAKGANGIPIETPDEVFVRVATNIAQAEANYFESDGEKNQACMIAASKFYHLMSSLDFLPNSPTLVHAGREMQQLSACFVLPVEDTMEEIFESVKQAAIIHKSGGGTGFSFSKLRPANSRVNKTAGVASGPVSFMQVFDKATEVIKQGGTRRGANMGILRIDHPNIRDFIHAKDSLTNLTNFNISVAVTDKFMDAMLNDEEFFELIDPSTNDIVGYINPTDLWAELCESAWTTGDPGIVFIDRINSGRANPVPTRGPIVATNPCGESPLYSFDSCNLGSINLSNFITDQKVDFARLSDVTMDCVHFLDNVIDMTKFPLPEIESVSKAIRRIGLGVMGWADMLIKLKIPYDSDEAVRLGHEVMSTISSAADKASIILGMKRGSFPDFNKSIYNDWPALRNSTRTTIAPTGTISIIAGCSSGIEPLFALEFTRSHYLADDPNERYEMTELHPAYQEWVKTGEKKLPDYFKTAQYISPQAHVDMQAAFQFYTDNAVSKTINIPMESTVEQIKESYLQAWNSGCNGITVYRDGCRSNQVLTTRREQVEEEVVDTDKRETVSPGSIRRRLNATRPAINHRFSVSDFEGYISVGVFNDGQPGEVFIIGNKTGSATRGYLDTIGIVTSLALQYGVPIDKIADKLTGTRFEPSGRTGDPEIPMATSIIDYVARWLRRQFVDKTVVPEYAKAISGDLCPECDSLLYYGEGCLTCQSCGYSRCG